MAGLGSYTTTELKHELEKRANPKFKEILFEHTSYLQEEIAKSLPCNPTPETFALATCLKRIKTKLKENSIPFEEY